MKRTLLLLAFALIVPAVAPAAPPTAQAEFDAGLTAYRRGDYQQALADFWPLAAQGYALAEYNLGLMYANGQGVTQDYAKALKWYRLAVAQGDAPAENNLGSMYYKGQGVPQNYVTAYKWYLIAKATIPATNRHYALVSQNVKSLAALMTPAQIAEAQQEASAWYAAHEHSGKS